jgi:hypothetical protein
MGRTIEHFMWGYQDMFRIHVEVSAESALGRLDGNLQPKVFLVGILEEDTRERFPACVEPEKEHWIESEAFDITKQLATSIGATYVESQLFQSHPLAQQRQDDALYRRSLRDAILQVVENHPGNPKDRSFFASVPEPVNGYLVSVVLSVNSAVLNSHYRMPTDSVILHEYRSMPVLRSLIDAVIQELLLEASDGLLVPDAGYRTIDRHPSETNRAAARRLATDTAFRVNRDDLRFHGFYEACDTISSLKYEQAEGRGRLLLAPAGERHINTRIRFKDGVDLKDYRRVRKLLELTSDGGLLHTDSKNIFGLVDSASAANVVDAFEVVFLGHHQWELRHAGELLMAVRFGEPYLPNLIGYESKLRKDFPRLLPGISTQAQELLVSLVRQAERARHGTLLVISAGAAAEAERLRNQATSTELELLTPELLDHLTGIDGAVLVDVNGCCHAIGVILDGQATSSGDPGRGARYNSAVRYVHAALARRIHTVAIVVSEDGGVDIFPNPPPAIKRTSLTAAIEEIETISKAAQTSHGRYEELYDWLLRHGFYLNEDDCGRVNAAIQAVEKRYDNEGRSIWIVRHTFIPDPKMDPAFYYEPED